MDATRTPARSFYIPCLDGIRAVAILLVFVGHAGLGNLVPGGFGVTVFFFLSGYLITSLLRLEGLETGTISLRNFYSRRALRILPPMYITLAVACVLGLLGVMRSVSAPVSYLAAVTFTTNYYSMLPIAVHWQGPGMETLWSLCIEEHFYLLFPLVYRGFLRRKFSPEKQAAILFVGCVLALLWRTVVVLVLHGISSGDSPKWTYSTTDCRFDSILWGAILAILNNAWFGDRSRQMLARHKDALMAIGIAGLLASLLYRNPVFRETMRYTLQGISLYPIFYYCIATDRSWLAVILQGKLLRWIGQLSYTLYLCHFYLLKEFELRFSSSHMLAEMLVTAALAVAYAWTMRKTVELPLQKLRRSLRRAVEPQATAALR